MSQTRAVAAVYCSPQQSLLHATTYNQCALRHRCVLVARQEIMLGHRNSVVHTRGAPIAHETINLHLHLDRLNCNQQCHAALPDCNKGLIIVTSGSALPAEVGRQLVCCWTQFGGRCSHSCAPSVLTTATAGLCVAADTCSNLLPCVRGAICTRAALCLHPRPTVLCTWVVTAELWSMMCACADCNSAHHMPSKRRSPSCGCKVSGGGHGPATRRIYRESYSLLAASALSCDSRSWTVRH